MRLIATTGVVMNVAKLKDSQTYVNFADDVPSALIVIVAVVRPANDDSYAPIPDLPNTFWGS